MSLNRTLDRLFDEIRREAKRNPDFANRIDAVLSAHASRRDIPEDIAAEIAPPEKEKPKSPPAKRAPTAPLPESAPLFSPLGLYQREGAEGLSAALSALDLDMLKALVAEHNLDPAGETEALDRDALAAHIVAHAKTRAERDAKLFDY